MPDEHRQLRRLLKLLKPHRMAMFVGLLPAMAAATAAVGLLAVSGWFIAAAAFAGLTPLTAHAFNMLHPSVAIRFFAILRTLSRYLERILNHDTTFKILTTLRTWLYTRIAPLAPSGLTDFRQGDLLNRLVADVDALDNLFIRVMTPTIVAGFITLAVPGLLAAYSPAAAWALLVFLVVAGLLVPIGSQRLGAATGRNLTHHSAQLRTHLVEGLQGMADLLVFNAGQRQIKRIWTAHRNLVKGQARMSLINGAAAAATTLLAGGALWSVLYIGVDLVAYRSLDGAHLALMAFATLAAFEAILPLSAAYQYLGQTRRAAGRLNEIVDRPPPISFPATAVKPANTGVVFDNVSFRYHLAAAPVLEAFDLAIAPGEHVAIMGATGAGKSTLVSLLCRFWDPVAGSVRIGNVDLRQWPEAQLRQSLAVVSQQAHLFNTSIRENLLWAKPDAEEDELWEALDKARLKTFVAGLANGLDTWTGELGQLISGGEARRLAVAQALLRDAPIWILDEPTEGLDATNERELMATIQTLTAQRTLLLITHRPAGLAAMDRVVILENGRMAEAGTYESLMAANGRLASMLDAIW
jgi:ATP-binding cassette subfamily C protein CydC